MMERESPFHAESQVAFVTRRERLRRAAEDGERLYRKRMFEDEWTVADDHRLHGILSVDLPPALGLVDELAALAQA
jgi:hypothetical protein